MICVFCSSRAGNVVEGSVVSNQIIMFYTIFFGPLKAFRHEQSVLHLKIIWTHGNLWKIMFLSWNSSKTVVAPTNFFQSQLWQHVLYTWIWEKKTNICRNCCPGFFNLLFLIKLFPNERKTHYKHNQLVSCCNSTFIDLLIFWPWNFIESLFNYPILLFTTFYKLPMGKKLCGPLTIL